MIGQTAAHIDLAQWRMGGSLLSYQMNGSASFSQSDVLAKLRKARDHAPCPALHARRRLIDRRHGAGSRSGDAGRCRGGAPNRRNLVRRVPQINSQDARALTEAPSFPQVANLPSTTALALNVFLHTSHADMPNFQLTRRQADDIIAYILSLKQE